MTFNRAPRGKGKWPTEPWEALSRPDFGKRVAQEDTPRSGLTPTGEGCDAWDSPKRIAKGPAVAANGCTTKVDGAMEHIKVIVRLRPMAHRELSQGCTQVVAINGSSTLVQEVRAGGQPPRVFSFDACFSSSPNDPDYMSQEGVMEHIGNKAVQSALGGFNHCVFAYGQTGSGKSYSMLGATNSPGLTPWTLERLLEEKQRMNSPGSDKEMRLVVSHLEIYNDNIHDLLDVNMQGGGGFLKLVDHPQLGVYVPGLSEVPCESMQQIHRLLQYGAKARMVAATSMNDHSSRSHAVYIARVSILTGTRPAAGEQDARRELNAKLNFVDLAGSERQSKSSNEGQVFKEGCAINKGLTALGLVIRKLAEKKKGPSAVVPFRTAKLTFLLKDSLSGNSKTAMLATISPASEALDETIGTLRFAQSVKEIKTMAVQNSMCLVDRASMVETLQRELEVLRAQGQLVGHEREQQRQLQEQLQEQEQLIAALKRDHEAELEAARTTDKLREQVVQEMAVSPAFLQSSLGVDRLTPCLLNLSDDASLAGCLLYYFPDGLKRSVGSAQDSSIRLRGLGIPSCLCVIENDGNTALSLTKSSNEGRVVVDGQPLAAGSGQHSLRHGQRIFLGRAFAFKVVVPADAQHAEEDDNTDLLLNGLEDDCATIEHSPTWSNMQDFVRHMCQHMPDEHSYPFLEEVKLAVKICDEANEITAECRKGEGLTFEADITGATRPSVVVRVLKSWGPDAVPQKGCQQLYIWSTSQMMERLDRMRECYHEFCHSGVLEVDGLLDPWHEAHISCIWHGLTNIRSQLEDTLAVNRLLRSQKVMAIRRTLNIWLNDRSDRSLRPLFQAWSHEAARAAETRVVDEKLQRPSMRDGSDVPEEMGSRAPSRTSTVYRFAEKQESVVVEDRGADEDCGKILDRFEMLLDKLGPIVEPRKFVAAPAATSGASDPSASARGAAPVFWLPRHSSTSGLPSAGNKEEVPLVSGSPGPVYPMLVPRSLSSASSQLLRRPTSLRSLRQPPPAMFAEHHVIGAEKSAHSSSATLSTSATVSPPQVFEGGVQAEVFLVEEPVFGWRPAAPSAPPMAASPVRQAMAAVPVQAVLADLTERLAGRRVSPVRRLSPPTSPLLSAIPSPPRSPGEQSSPLPSVVPPVGQVTTLQAVPASQLVSGAPLRVATRINQERRPAAFAVTSQSSSGPPSPRPLSPVGVNVVRPLPPGRAMVSPRSIGSSASQPALSAVSRSRLAPALPMAASAGSPRVRARGLPAAAQPAVQALPVRSATAGLQAQKAAAASQPSAKSLPVRLKYARVSSTGSL
eukprot:TRINITY_DN27232_c0_g1_i1.p1 TRINITY_DN27232_c0_g1~~TRINITY_DN27232_c0_g1_i1.p1  ORF type:complete len:1306 (-),score=299.57 TRINITY_DN27232_c0_g1_i1:137-4054(-)